MAQGRKTGGRVKGVPNKATSEVVKVIDGLCGPSAARCFQKLSEIALAPHDNVKARLIANQTLIAYRHGRPREMVEVSGPDGGPIPTLVQFVDA